MTLLPLSATRDLHLLQADQPICHMSTSRVRDPGTGDSYEIPEAPNFVIIDIFICKVKS